MDSHAAAMEHAVRELNQALELAREELRRHRSEAESAHAQLRCMFGSWYRPRVMMSHRWATTSLAIYVYV